MGQVMDQRVSDRPPERGSLLREFAILLGFMFLMEPPPQCLKACDFDDSGNLGLPDAINLLAYLFLMGPEPPPPFPEPGLDPTPDPLPCL